MLEGIDLYLPFVKEREMILKKTREIVEFCLNDKVNIVKEEAQRLLEAIPFIK